MDIFEFAAVANVILCFIEIAKLFKTTRDEKAATHASGIRCIPFFVFEIEDGAVKKTPSSS